ncbi:aromatic acid exporter family protein [bacterium LRH843]|nr:aromatic acid exporter family protein [bacterium LRH843]
MEYKIGYRTLKTAVGAAVSIAIAQALQLEFYAMAAIITIICISNTRRSSLRLSWERIAASVIGIGLSSLLFEWIGYYPWTLSIIILLFIPAAVMIKMKEGIVQSIVIITHLYTVGTVSYSLIINELLLLCIGVGVALVMNFYMPANKRELRRYHREIEHHFKIIIHEMAKFLRNGESEWDGKEIPKTVELLTEGKNLAFQSIQNQLVRYEDQYYYYFKMREKQFEILERMMPYVSTVHDAGTESKLVADFLSEVGRSVSPVNRVPYFLERLADLKQTFDRMPLPTTQEEFEVRSTLRYVMYELEQYLLIKDRLWNKEDKKKL